MSEKKRFSLRDLKPSNVARSVATRTGKNLNALLDAVDGFEKRGGFSRIVDEQLSGPTARAVLIGAPGQKTLRQYYANLEVPFGSDMPTVKKAYKKLMRRYHPDKHSGDPERERLATQLAQELTQAYNLIREHHEARKRLWGGQ